MAMIHGAEATVEPVAWMGRDLLSKRRVAKPYRHVALDERLRAERTRDEASILLAARAAGVPVPRLYDVDRHNACLIMERIDGPSLREVLATASDEQATKHLHELGTHVARLHDAGLTHGDLTTSNVLVPDNLVLIDFGLGQFSQEDEPHGVDLHLVEEALDATDDRAPQLFAAFVEGYKLATRSEAVLLRLADIRQRGRYH